MTRLSRLIAVIAIALVVLWVTLPRREAMLRAAPPNLTIVYPSAGATLFRVTRSFIFGSADPGSTVTVNASSAFVAPSGGWIAYVPFAPGRFRLHVVARRLGYTVSVDRVVYVIPPLRTTPAS